MATGGKRWKVQLKLLRPAALHFTDQNEKLMYQTIRKSPIFDYESVYRIIRWSTKKSKVPRLW
jgi:hypothetical protein